MRQLNLNVTPEFEQDLKRLMSARGLTSQSEAIRAAVHEVAEETRKPLGLDRLAGLAKRYPQNPKPKFRNEDELWS